jgi:hypothetical protein
MILGIRPDSSKIYLIALDPVFPSRRFKLEFVKAAIGHQSPRTKDDQNDRVENDVSTFCQNAQIFVGHLKTNCTQDQFEKVPFLQVILVYNE